MARPPLTHPTSTLASCLPLLGGVRGGFLLPLASCLLPQNPGLSI
ncbi:hypothetical protein [Moorena sp. SIOASIH]|nr:hypothetical protein [Moorena sp. SIOASIH]